MAAPGSPLCYEVGGVSLGWGELDRGGPAQRGGQFVNELFDEVLYGDDFVAAVSV